MFGTADPDILEAIQKAKQTAQTAADREKLSSAERLVNLQRSYEQQTRFNVGDLVMWKDGMRNRRLPAYGQVVIVSAVFDGVQYSAEKSSGSPYFREPETIKIASIDEDDGEFVEFCMDQQRFRLASEDECIPRVVQQLRQRLQILLKPTEKFQVGDRVYWKPLMKHKRRPNKEPAIVMEVLEQPILDTEKPGSQYWRENLDLKVALRDSDGELISFFFDSRRFQKIDDDDDTYGSLENGSDEEENDDDDEEDEDDASYSASDVD